MAKYKALAKGYAGDRYIEEGEIFEYYGPKGKWMQPVSADTPVTVAVDQFEEVPGQPNTFSGINKKKAAESKAELERLQGKAPEKK